MRLLQVAESLARVRTSHEARPGPASSPSWKLTDNIRALVKRVVRGNEKRPRPAAQSHPDSVLINAPMDVAWAHTYEPLTNLVHVFHQEWHGIRAAAGYLPGVKIAITVHTRLGLDDLEEIVAACGQHSHPAVVFHGWSDNATLIARCLREALGGDVRIAAVWHGNTAQFINPFEMKQLAMVVGLAKEKLIDRLESVKPDLALLDDAFGKDVLLNVGPAVRAPIRRVRDVRSALVPVPLDWRKNLHTNIFACNSAGLRDVYVTAPLEEKWPFALSCKLHRVHRPTRAELLTLISTVDLVMNASLSECQPMTALEALSYRVPCITGPLSLGALDDHPLQRLVQVAGVDALGPVTRAIKRVAELAKSDAEELRELMASYEQTLLASAFGRYERIAQ